MTEKKTIITDENLKEITGGAGMMVIGEATILTTNLNIRAKADKDSAWMGETSRPAKFNVYEIVQNQGYIWYRIADNMWIANDGTWVAFSTK